MSTSDDLDIPEITGLGRLFPLPGVVLFPHVVLPLHIFEPRYRQLMRDALASDRLITIVQTSPGAWTEGEDAPLEAVGCVGRILQHQRFPDGRYNLLLHGRCRVRIVREVPAPTLYRQALLEAAADLAPLLPVDQQLHDLMALLTKVLRESNRTLDEEMKRLLESRPSLEILSNILAHTLRLPPDLKQRLLEERDPSLRAASLGQLLRGEAPAPRLAYPPPISPN